MGIRCKGCKAAAAKTTVLLCIGLTIVLNYLKEKFGSLKFSSTADIGASLTDSMTILIANKFKYQCPHCGETEWEIQN